MAFWFNAAWQAVLAATLSSPCWAMGAGSSNPKGNASRKDAVLPGREGAALALGVDKVKHLFRRSYFFWGRI